MWISGYGVNQLIFEPAGTIDTERNWFAGTTPRSWGNYTDAKEMEHTLSQDGLMVWRGAQLSGLAVPTIPAARNRLSLALRFRRRGCALHPLPRHREHQSEGLSGCARTSGAL
jgi:hypothetical protein